MTTILTCAVLLKVITCSGDDAFIRADAILDVRNNGGLTNRSWIEINHGENICIMNKSVPEFVEAWDKALIECQK